MFACFILKENNKGMYMKLLILGANGFIGSHLCEAILAKKNWTIAALDLFSDKVSHCLSHPRFEFYQGDMTASSDWLTFQFKNCDVVLPLAAIATPALYVKKPLLVFELDFEANLSIIRQCVQWRKRVIFPSTSEVYGMCKDAVFDEEKSFCVTGPIHKERWIYANIKQLLDRIIYAYGKDQQLNYSLFRPFNWYGPKLDSLTNPHARVVTRFIGNILRQEEIVLVNGGEQQRCFTYIDDGITALLKIIENKNNIAHNQIFNIGNPAENVSIKQLAKLLVEIMKDYPGYENLTANKTIKILSADNYYGEGYEDIDRRIPAIHRAQKYLNWQPDIDLMTGLKKTVKAYLV